MYLDQKETEHLIIRKLDYADIPAWESFFINNNNLPFLGLNMDLDAKAQSKEWIELQLQRYNDNRFGHHALIHKKTNKLVGQCGLLTQEIDNEKVVEIGYHILPEYWGQGYASEAAMKFRDYAFQNMICDSLVSIIHIDNIASQRVAEKNGMKKIKQTRYYNMDVYVYQIKKAL